MALVKCKECGAEVSTKASHCPKCGAKAPKKTSPAAWVVLVLILFAFYISNQDTSPSSNNSGAAEVDSSSEDKNADVDESEAKAVEEVDAEPTEQQQATAEPQWHSFESEDEMTGDAASYASSPRTTSNRPLDFPYQGTESWLGFGCDGAKEWAYVGFSNAPNLNNTETKNGYNLITTRVKWDESVVRETLTQKWGDPFLSFRNDSQVIRRVIGSNTVLIELDWHAQNRTALFPYTLLGSSDAITEARQRCSTY